MTRAISTLFAVFVTALSASSDERPQGLLWNRSGLPATLPLLIKTTGDANWTFAPLPGTSVLFDTGPKAADYSDSVDGVSIEAAGEGPDGFARFRIQL